MAHALEAAGEEERIFDVNNNPIIAGPGQPGNCWSLGTGDPLPLAANEANRDTQSLTGPGDFTASLMAHAARLKADGQVLDFELLTQWDVVVAASGRSPTEPTCATGGTGSAAKRRPGAHE